MSRVLCCLLGLFDMLLISPADVLADDRGGLAASTRLEINMGPVSFLTYTTDPPTPAMAPHCASAPTVQMCIRAIVPQYVAQGVTGVRFQFHLPDGLNAPDTWEAGAREFFKDLYNGGIMTITPTINWSGWGQEGHEVILQDPCDANQNRLFRFYSTSPIAGVCKTFQTINGITTCTDLDQNGNQIWNRHGYGCIDNAYNLSPPNTPPNSENFLGWDNLIGVVNPNGLVNRIIRAAAHPFGDQRRMNIEQLDGENELDLFEDTAAARYIVDNTHGNYDVLTNLRQVMINNGYAPERVTYSTVMVRTWYGYTDGIQTYDCPSYYGDSARIMPLSALSQGIWGYAGNRIGQPSGQSGREPGNDRKLPCGGIVGDQMPSLPMTHTQPTVIGPHVKPCLLAPSGFCTAPFNHVADEGKVDFTAIKNFIASYDNGWRGYDPNLAHALVIFGETHGATVANGFGGDTGCPTESGNWNVSVPQDTVAGFNDSPLAGYTLTDGSPGVVFRPWENLADISPTAAPCNPITVNPPYSPSSPAYAPAVPSDGFWPSGATSTSQWFTFKWSDLNGWRNLAQMHALFNTTTDTATGCYIRTDGISVWLGNSSGACSLANANLTRTGTTIQLDLLVTAAANFTGTKNAYMLAQDASGNYSNGGQFLSKGTWNLPGSCTYSLSQPGASFLAAASTGSVNVITQAGCAWTATSNQAWTAITSGSSGTGNGTVSYSVAANVARTRQGSLTVAGQTYTITQAVPASLTLTGSLTSTVYEALDSIVADNLTAGPGVTFAVKNGTITLRPGFSTAAAPTTFRAFIDPTIQ